MSDLALCYDAVAACADDVPLDALNLIAAHQHALSKDTPGKAWWNAAPLHPAIFRALRMDRSEEGAVFAALPLRLARTDRGARILVAFPCPRVLGPVDTDWLGIETVLSWDPVTDTAELLGDEGPALIGTVPDDCGELNVFGSPYAFLRALAEERACWSVQRANGFRPWQRKPDEPQFHAGLLLIGNADEVHWPRHRMPETIVAHGVDAKQLNRALLKQARVPHARSGQLRRAA